MKRKKYRKRKNSRVLVAEFNRLEKEVRLKKPEFSKIESDEIILTDVDKITHIRRVDSERTILEVVNVSYETKVEGEWITIVRFDSAHGFLHRHLRISLNDPQEIINTAGVKKKGTVHTWYTWAIKDILLKYLDYKKGFIERSKGV